MYLYYVNKNFYFGLRLFDSTSFFLFYLDVDLIIVNNIFEKTLKLKSNIFLMTMMPFPAMTIISLNQENVTT